MGIGGISVGSLLIVLVIVLLLFGTRKLRNIGGDLGGAVKSFRSSMKDVGGDVQQVREDLSVSDSAEQTVGTQTGSRDKVS